MIKRCNTFNSFNIHVGVRKCESQSDHTVNGDLQEEAQVSDQCFTRTVFYHQATGL